MAKTKERMNDFLSSFDSTITIHTVATDTTHLSTEHRKDMEKVQTTAPYSTVTFEELAKTPDSLRAFNSYKRDGFVVLEDVMAKDKLEMLQHDTKSILLGSKLGENDFYGHKTKRAYNILSKSRSLDDLLCSPRLTRLVDALFAPNALCSAIQLIEILPGEIAQKLHYDQQFSNLGTEPRGPDYIMTCILAIDDFTEDNGATVLIPGSHVWPAERLPAPTDEHKKLVIKAGSLGIYSGNTWHGGGANNTTKSRRAIVIAFIQPWLRPLENYFLSVPFPLAASLPLQIQSYMGYSLHHPFVGQVDFQHPRKKLLELAKL